MSARGGRRRTRRAFTIIEVIVIVVILGVIASVISLRLLPRIGQSKRVAAEANAAALASGVRLFAADHAMPQPGASIRILWERPSDVDEADWNGPYVDNEDALLDPWGNEFVLRIPGEKNVDFDVVSYGADGQPGGEGEAADVIKP